MTIEEQLKQEILSRYKSIRAFTTAIDIPYSTLDSALKRGISNAGISTMIKVFNALDLDVEGIAVGTLLAKNTDTQKSPSTAEAAPGEDNIKLMNYLKRGIYDLGFLPEGSDLTDRQVEALLGVGAILHAIFDEHQE